MDNQRNLILAIVLSALVLLGWQFASDRFFPAPKAPVAATPPSGQLAPAAQAPGQVAAADNPKLIRARAAVLGESPRIAIDTPKLAGSINLRGARIDDLILKTYWETVERKQPVRLMSPQGGPNAYYAGFGWTGDGIDAPGPNSLWTADAKILRPSQPVTLSWNNGRGQLFQTVIAVDADYMFTITQRLSNGGAGAVAARPYGLVARVGASHDPWSWTARVGAINKQANVATDFIKYTALDEAGANGVRFNGAGGWVGFSDKYWLTALVPDRNAAVQSGFLAPTPGVYQAVETGAPVMVAPGKGVVVTQRLFAGAKEVNVLDRYEETQGIEQLGRAIDWGWFRVLEKPMFWLLDHLFKLVGNFGVAIIALTFLVRGVMFPIAQKQFRSMAGMRRVQPKMKELQERHKDDKPRLQQELLKLYQEEKVNPLAGCLPILVQIPVFYSLYKVLMVTIEMRHQPFVLWIKDLSAPDPAHILNLFGLLDFQPPAFLGIGILAILLGVSMWLQFRLNPQPMDDAQKQIFALMPWIMMFIMAPFAAGLLIYWITSNFLTIAQQAWLYRQYPIPPADAAAATVVVPAQKTSAKKK